MDDSKFGLTTSVKNFIKYVDEAEICSNTLSDQYKNIQHRRFPILWSKNIWHFNEIFSLHNLFFIFIGSLLGKKLILAPHGMVDKWAMENKHNLLKQILLKTIVHINQKQKLLFHCLTQNEVSQVKKYCGDVQVFILPNPIPNDVPYTKERNRTGSGDTITIGCLSRISKKKNQLELISLIEFLSKQEIRIKLIIAGDVEESEYYQLLLKEIDASSFKSSVQVISSVPPQTRFSVLNQLDFFVLPSRSEGYPFVAIEAIALGIPTICFPGANCEFIEPYGGMVSDDYWEIHNYIKSRPLMNKEQFWQDFHYLKIARKFRDLIQ